MPGKLEYWIAADLDRKLALPAVNIRNGCPTSRECISLEGSDPPRLFSDKRYAALAILWWQKGPQTKEFVEVGPIDPEWGSSMEPTGRLESVPGYEHRKKVNLVPVQVTLVPRI